MHSNGAPSAIDEIIRTPDCRSGSPARPPAQALKLLPCNDNTSTNKIILTKPAAKSSSTIDASEKLDEWNTKGFGQISEKVRRLRNALARSDR